MEILHDDPHLIAVNKSAPLLTQAPPGVPSLEAAVKAYIQAKYNKPGGVYLGVPHRLDRPVSGVVVFARNTKAAQKLQAQFETRSVVKTYWALVAGAVTEAAGVWADWMRKVPDEPRAEPAAEGGPGAKFAELAYRVVARDAGTTLLELSPTTGRMHQLRAQAAWRGHPVLGDRLYGSAAAFGPALPADALDRDRVIALHARRLAVSHPVTGVPLVLEAAVPGYWPVRSAEGRVQNAE